MRKLTALIFILLTFGSCYSDYVKDYEFSGVYVANQFDLRTFVVGEGMNFDIGVVLGGIRDNNRDRAVEFHVAPELVTGDLSGFVSASSDDEGESSGYGAIDVILDRGGSGKISNVYVTNDIQAAGTTSLAPLPEEFYTLSDNGRMVIRSGRHTATVKVQANEAILADPNAYRPYYALAFCIDKADVDTVIYPKSFEVVVVRVENMLYGNWWHGGVTRVVDDTTGETVSESVYRTEIPHREDRVYVLTTESANSLTTNRMGDGAGALRLEVDGGAVTVSSADGSRTIEPLGEGSSYNRAKLLQNRKIMLNYKYSNGDGTTTMVQDTLTFRNRVRDGIVEWQDENPENYK